MKVVKNEINPALQMLMKTLQSPAQVLAIANTAKTVIVNRTVVEKLSTDRAAFKAYSTRRYYAPIEKRPVGYPMPSGGRTKALRGGRKLKTMVFDGGYGEYKAGLGLGSAPQLSVSNQMLSDIQTQVLNPKKAIVFFGSRLSAAKAHGLHTGKFPFFDLHVSEHRNLYETLRQQLMKIKGMKS